MNTQHPLLALHPASRGLGWILFERPHSPFDWGTAHIERNRNAAALAKVQFLFTRFQPKFLVLETFEGADAKRRRRTQHLCRAILREAERSGMIVRLVSRQEIAAALGARTRPTIAARIAKDIPALKPRLPKPRPIWVGESLNMALFNATACALTHYAQERSL